MCPSFITFSTNYMARSFLFYLLLLSLSLHLSHFLNFTSKAKISFVSLELKLIHFFYLSKSASLKHNVDISPWRKLICPLQLKWKWEMGLGLLVPSEPLFFPNMNQIFFFWNNSSYVCCQVYRPQRNVQWIFTGLLLDVRHCVRHWGEY